MKDMQIAAENCSHAVKELRHQMYLLILTEFVNIKNYRKRMKFIKKAL